MHNKLIIVLSMLALSGCMSTPNEVREKTANFTAESNKESDDLASCIYEGWTNTRALLERDNTTHTERGKGRITVFTWHDTMFADIAPIGDGKNKVSFYKTVGGAYVLADNRIDVIKSCI